jgi:hypothetical protein
VPKQNKEAAIRLLREDAQQKGYWIQIGDDYYDNKEPTPSVMQMPIGQVLATPEFAEDKPLGRFLRSAEMSTKLAAYPFVELLSIREQEYLATKDEMQVGYEVDITLYSKQGDDSQGLRHGYLVWANGMEIWSRGGSEWSRTN